MSSRKRTASLAAAAMLITLGLYGGPARGDITGIEEDGWYTWRIKAVDSAPEQCCYRWRQGSPQLQQCNLDGRHGGFNFSDDEYPASDDVQIYVRMKSGNASRIRAYGTQCPVTANTDITTLAAVGAGDSIAWLEERVGNGSRLSSEAIAAIAVHDTLSARDVLLKTSANGNHKDDREQAIFWMALARFEESESALKKFMFEDESAKIREHAAFSYAQSPAPDISDMLIRQGRNDKSPHVRSQAWFWLAQTGAPESAAAIHRALLNDVDADVREEAVFALSQLPDDQSVTALVQLLRDRQLDMNIREQALFWLAQSDSDEAFAAIDQLLGKN